MKFNVFEGARRIALLLAVVATLAVVAVAATHDPYLSLRYTVSLPGAPFVRSGEVCPLDADSHYFSTTTTSGHSIGVELCLLPSEFGKDGQKLIPYQIDKAGIVWGAASYSSEVSSYERELEKSFKLPTADETWANSEIAKRYRSNWLSSLGFLAVGLAIYWAIVWSIGWIVRGFAGIPRGKDSRPSEV